MSLTLYDSVYIQKFTLTSVLIIITMSKLIEYKNLIISKIDHEFSMKQKNLELHLEGKISRGYLTILPFRYPSYDIAVVM